MRRLAIGDIHGNLNALISALDQVNYDPDNDQLFFVGDYIDRHPYSREVITYILELPNKICIRGNHDQFFIDYLKQDGTYKTVSSVWENNGARTTLESYGMKLHETPQGLYATSGTVPKSHVQFFQSLKPYHFTADDMAIVHGGFDLNLADMSMNFVIWDRLMWKTACKMHPGHPPYPCFNKYRKIFIGHTNLLDHKEQRYCLPKKRINVWNIDTGAGFMGPLTIMDMDTEEYWQSE